MWLLIQRYEFRRFVNTHNMCSKQKKYMDDPITIKMLYIHMLYKTQSNMVKFMYLYYHILI